MSTFDSINSNPRDHQPLLEESNFLQASSKFFQETYEHPEARARQAAAVVDGCIVGAIKAAPDRIINHPVETCTQIAIGFGTGALFGLAATIDAPIVAGALAVGGTAMTLQYTWDLAQRLNQDQNLQKSLNDIWCSNDFKTYNSALPTVEKGLGGESFDLAVASLSAVAGGRGTKLIGDKLASNFANTNLCLDGAPLAVPENIKVSAKIPDNTFAMVWHRDRLGYEWDKIDPKTLESYISKTPLSKRLNIIESAIKDGQLYKAYDHAEANLKWHNERSGSYKDEHDRLSQQFHNIAMSIRNSWDEPGKPWLDKARGEIKLTREQFSDNTGWPEKLKATPENLLQFERLYKMPTAKRVEEIQALVQNGLFKDAADLAHTNYILHRNSFNTSWDCVFNGTHNKLFDPEISDRFDTVSLHLYRMYDEGLSHLVPETSVVKINEQLESIKKM
jgi:hypothetical protein